MRLSGLKFSIVMLCVLLCCSFDACTQTAVTSPPPAQVVFVPDPGATLLSKHPTLPLLYVVCNGVAESKNLETFRLNADGSIIADSKKVCDNYFTQDGKNPDLVYSLVRPSVLPDKNILYLAAQPGYPAKYFAVTNNNEFAAVALDDQGQPSKLLRAFRLDNTAREPLMIDMRCEPTTRRLYIAYYVYFGWCALGNDGLPVSDKFNPISCPINQWYWAYIPEWKRFFTMPPGPSLNIFKLNADSAGMEFGQTIPTSPGTPLAGNLAVSEKNQRVYVLGALENKELSVYQLTKEGRLMSLPRECALGETLMMRFDFKNNLLYAFTKDGMLKTWALDSNGFPSGAPKLHSLSCGGVRDALVDEVTGKLYIACSQPPKANP